jgi:hypothetical protein
MSAYLETLYDGLRTIISAQWPDVDATGIYEADHLDMLPWENLTPPYAVISISSMAQDTTIAAVDALAYLPMVEIYYVALVSGPRSPIRAKLETLRDALWQSVLEVGQVWNIPSLDWSADLPANQTLAVKGMGMRAGRIQVQVLLNQIA